MALAVALPSGGLVVGQAGGLQYRQSGQPRVEAHRTPTRREFERMARRRAQRRRVRLLRTLLVIGVLLIAGMRAGRLGLGPLAGSQSTSHGNMTPVAARTYVVQPGDTDWSIAASYVEGHDVRPYVDAIAGQHAGRMLQVGDIIELP